MYRGASSARTKKYSPNSRKPGARFDSSPQRDMMICHGHMASINIAVRPARSFTVRCTRRYATHRLMQETMSCGRRMTHTFNPKSAMNGIIR